MKPGPSVCVKPQEVVGPKVAQHPKFHYPMVVVLVGQILHETALLFGTYQALVNTNFLTRCIVMHEYYVFVVHKELCTGIVVWFSRGWKSFDLGDAEEVQKVGKAMLGKHFPKLWGGFGTESA
jgi:hypothetical protein